MGGSGALAVVGASGGLGASVLAAAVAVRAHRGGVDVVAVDLCPLGGGLDVTLGAEQERGVRWPDLAGLSGSADGPALADRLPLAGGVPVLSFDRGAGRRPEAPVVSAVLSALVGTGRLVVVDGTPGGSLSEPVWDLVREVVVLAGPSLRQLAALAAVAGWLRDRGLEPLVCLRGNRGAAQLVPLVESELGLRVLGLLRDDRSVPADLGHGVPPGSRARGPLAAIADALLARALIATAAGKG